MERERGKDRLCKPESPAWVPPGVSWLLRGATRHARTPAALFHGAHPPENIAAPRVRSHWRWVCDGCSGCGSRVPQVQTHLALTSQLGGDLPEREVRLHPCLLILISLHTARWPVKNLAVLGGMWAGWRRKHVEEEGGAPEGLCSQEWAWTVTGARDWPEWDCL